MVIIQFSDAVAITARANQTSFPDGVGAPSGFLCLIAISCSYQVSFFICSDFGSTYWLLMEIELLIDDEQLPFASLLCDLKI